MSSVDITNKLNEMTNATSRMQAESATKKTGTSEMDQNAFLQLLMAQLKYQDPMKPLDNSQFVAQQAQFTQISELQKLNKSVAASNQIMEASSLIGKQVGLTDPNNTNNIISGVVDAAKIDSTGASVIIQGNSYPLANVISIQNSGTSAQN